MKKITSLWSCMLLICMTFFVSNSLKAQVTLGASPYTQNFDAISAGLPAGWSVRTGANATALGTSGTLVTVATAWNNTTGNFRNVASATGLTSTANVTDQSNATNRALGVRQGSSFGDPGAAFVLQLDNTTGKTNFQMNFKLQSLDNGASITRTTTWTVDYGIGATPTTFTATTPTGTLTTGNVTFSNNTINVNFGTALDNQSSNVWIRIIALTGTTGSGSRATTGIDDINLSWSSGGPVPTLVANPSTIADFGSVNNAATSTNSSYTLTATSVTSDVIITAPTNFQVARGITGTYESTITYTATELATVQTVGVRFAPTSGTNGVKSGNITHSGFSGTTVAVSGTETGNVVVPTLTTSLSTLNTFATVGINTFSGTTTYTLTGANLTNDVIVTAPANFQVAKTSTGTYGSSITYTIAELATTQSVGVRFAPTSGVVGLKSDNITHTSIGATTVNVAVSGTENITNTLPHLQTFNYTTGQPLQTQSGFVALNTGDDLNVTTNSLSYTGLPTSTGNKASFAGAGIDTYFDFSVQNSNTVYYSFLLNITDFTGITSTTGTYFAGLIGGNGTTTFGGNVYVKSDGTGYQIGINPRTTAANTVFTTGTPMTLNTTYMVVGSYTINTTTTNDDVVKLWVNPTLGAMTEPTPLLQATQSISAGDLETIARFLIRQDANTSTPALDIDELRIGTSWTDVTPMMVVPTLVANPTTIADFGSVNNGANSTASSYTLTATNVTNDVIVTAPTNFQVAKTTTGVYGNTITYTATELATVQTVGVRFSPTSGTNGVKSGNITHSGFTGTTVAVSGTETGNGAPNINLFLGTNTNPLFAVATGTNLNLGNLPFSTFGTTFTIQNAGNANLTLGTITFSGTDGANATITSTPTSPVAASGTTTFNVSYTPTSIGAKTVIFNLPNNDVNKNPYIVTMNFTIVAPMISVSQAATNISNNNSPAYNMGSAVVGNNLDVTFTITNTGNSPMTINTPIGITGTGFSILTQPAGTVANGTSNTTTFVVRYNSASVVSNTAGVITIGNNSMNTTSYVVNVVASATAAPTPTIALSQAATNISNNNSPAFNIGTTTIGTAITQTFTITNSGTAALSITNPLSVTGNGYSVTTAPATSVGFAAPNNTTTFMVSFNPTATGTITGNVTITNGTGTDFVLNLTGTANPAPAPTIAISQAGNSITNGGNFNMGTTATNIDNDKVFTITNGGNANLTITTPIGITGTGYSIFAQPTSPVAFGASNTTTFTVRFNSASAVTNAAGTVTIANNAGANFVINLTATTTVPTVPTLVVTPTTLSNFGSVQTNQASVNQTYTLIGSNLTGNATVVAPTGWDISKDGTLFTNSLTYIPSELLTAQTIRVRFRPVSNVLGAKTGNITHTSAGATTINIAVAGTEITPNALESFNSDFVVSPNPAETFINIKCDKPTRWQKAAISFYTLDGKSTSNYTWEDASQTLQIDVKNWNRGAYILNIVEGNKIATKKIIVR